ncbi:MAG: EAL domain-containing protein [Bacilli bacterium]|nr:EAL domain-containing protein [Bacilli bacterium]
MTAFRNEQDLFNLKKTVLVVEDNDINREILKSILDERYIVLEATNGKEALDIVKNNAEFISLILLDIQMPVLDGYGFLDEYNKHEDYKKIPVIVTTSEGDEEEHALEKGASDFVTKPYKPNVILKRVEALIRLKESVGAILETRLDHKTGLINREFFHYVSDNVLKKADVKLTYILCIIQDFTYMNTTYGEDDCDKLLKVMGSIFQKYGNNALAMARYGGDNLAFVINSEVDYKAIIEDIEKELHELSPIPNVSLKHIVYENVDKSLKTNNIMNKLFTTYHSNNAKSEGSIIFFDKTIIEKENYRHLLVEYMDDSIKNEDFKIYIQPKHDCKTDELVGAEALVRWIHPELGFISPGDFIPTFEETGLITKLDEFIVKKTCEFLAKCKKLGLKEIPISVNLSRRDLAVFADPKLLTKAVKHFGFNKEQLHFEITESLAGNSADVLAKAKIIRDEGFKIEIDDFGSGYSCLGMISDIPMDYLKLDITFARRLEAQKDVVKHVIALAHELGAKVFAEGVENEEQKNIYRDLGCDAIQGYFYSKPLPEDEFITYLKNHK